MGKQTVSTTTTGKDVLIQISTRIPKALHIAAKAAVIEDETPLGLMQFIREAMEEKLRRRKK